MEKGKRIMTIRLPEELHELLKRQAQKEGLSINTVVIMALWEYDAITQERISRGGVKDDRHKHENIKHAKHR